METKFEFIKTWVNEMGFEIQSEDKEEELIVISDEDSGIIDLIIDCEDPILVMEQVIMEIPEKNKDNLYKRLLQMNREIVHGAFAMDDDESYIIFRDTLQLENLDRNEIEGSLRALELALSEYGEELITLSKN
ncbi:MAG: molecular chaperone Tir [Deltaproteobacteria bacterium]|nr:MAG: molecular chaperone Tir [Deltaproteobacteria bacterium]PIE74546.1 MAG: molecular chaperone Tir [Deltaproteobacteria bacterium]